MGTQKKIGALLLALLFIAIPRTMVAQNDDCAIIWSNPVQVSFDSVPSNVPHLAVYGDTIHALWYGLDTLGSIANDGIQYSRSTDGGQTFAPQVRLASADSGLDAGSIACNNNFVFVTFLAFIDTFYGTALLRSSDAGATWQPLQYLLSYANPRLIVTNGNNVYIHYYDQVGDRFGLLRSSDEGNSWSVANINMPQLSQIVPTPGFLHGIGEVAYDLRREIGYYFSFNAGGTWFGPEILSLEDVTSSNLPSLAANEEGELFATWNDTGTIIMRQSGLDENEDLIWKPEIALTQTHGAVFTDIAAEGKFVSVVWDNEFDNGGGIRLRTSNNLAASFCPVTSPTASVTAGAPSVKIIGDRIHLLWSDRVDTNGEILYRTGVLMKESLPKSFALEQNYPNPFNGFTTISYDITNASDVDLTVYNLLGQRIVTLVHDYQFAQRYTLSFPSDNLPSGVYFYRLVTGSVRETKKMIIVK